MSEKKKVCMMFSTGRSDWHGVISASAARWSTTEAELFRDAIKLTTDENAKPFILDSNPSYATKTKGGYWFLVSLTIVAALVVYHALSS